MIAFEQANEIMTRSGIGKALDFLKVVRLVFWSGVVGPGTNDFYPLQRAKFTGGISPVCLEIK